MHLHIIDSNSSIRTDIFERARRNDVDSSADSGDSATPSFCRSLGNVELVFDELSHGAGELYVADDKMYWFASDNTAITGALGTGFGIAWRDILMHAIQRSQQQQQDGQNEETEEISDAENALRQRACLYCHLDTDDDELEDEDESMQEDGAAQSTNRNPSVMRLFPVAQDQQLASQIVQQLFDEFSTCAELNPDADGDDDMEDANDSLMDPSDRWIFNDEEVRKGTRLHPRSEDDDEEEDDDDGLDDADDLDAASAGDKPSDAKRPRAE